MGIQIEFEAYHTGKMKRKAPMGTNSTQHGVPRPGIKLNFLSH